MLEELSQEQQALITKVRDKWLDLVFESKKPLDKQKTTDSIKWLYSLAELPAPLVVILDSPRGCQIASNIIKKENLSQVWDQVESQIENQVMSQVGNQVRSQVWNQVWGQVRSQVEDRVWGQVEIQVRGQVWDRVWGQVRSQVEDRVWGQVEIQVRGQVWDRVWDQVWTQVGRQVSNQVGSQVENQVWNQVRSQICDQVWNQVVNQVRDQVRSQVWSQVWNQVWDQVERQVWNQVRDQVESQKLEYFAPAGDTLLTNSGWVSFYDYFREIDIVKHAPFDKYIDYLQNGPSFYAIFMNGVAFVCGRPEYIKRDEQNRLHCEDGPAVRWKDGYANYFWHGVSVTEKLIETPESITKDNLEKEDNAEVRRAMMEKLGDRFYSLLDIVERSRELVGQGDFIREAVLYQTKEPDPVAGDYIQYVQVTCHSTGRQYMLCVPADIESPKAAITWTFGLEQGEYTPIAEA